MSKTPTLADKYPDPCEACRPYGGSLGPRSCRNYACSQNAYHTGAIAATKPGQGPGKRKRKLGLVERLKKQLRQQRAIWGPRTSPAKRVVWGEDEQRSERAFELAEEARDTELVRTNHWDTARKTGRWSWPM